MRWARIFFYLLLALVGLECIWVFAVNRYLQSPSFHQLLQKGGNQISYDSAISLFPGQINVKGFTLQNRETLIELPELHLQFSIMGLAGKKIIFWSARSMGGVVRYIPAKTSSGNRTPSPVEVPSVRESESKSSSTASWSVHFQKLIFEKLNVLTIGSFLAKGDMEFEATLHIGDDNRLAMPSGRVRLRETEMQWKDQKAAQVHNLQGRFELTPIGLRDKPLRKLSLDLTGAAELEQGEVLQALLADVPWLKINGLHVHTEGRLVLEQGRLIAPTQVECKTQNLHLDVWKEVFTGDGSFVIQVDREQKLNLDLGLPAFSVSHQKDAPPVLRGSGLTLHLQTLDLDLRSQNRAWQAAFRLQAARVHDLSALNHFLPQGLGFQFKGGEADLFVNLDSRTPVGNVIVLDSRNAHIAYDKHEFFGRLKNDFHIGTIDFAQEGFTIPDGDITLKVKHGGPSSTEPDWAGLIHLSQGRMEVRSPTRFEADLKVKAQDLRPLLWFYDPQQKLPDWARKLFNQESLGAQFHLKADENSYAIDNLQAQTRDLKLEAWYQGMSGKKRGKLFVRYKGLSAGIGVNDDTFKIQMLSSKEWFQDRRM